MTEQQWLSCAEPQKMLEFLGDKCSKRKMRLFIADGVKSLKSIFGAERTVLAAMHERVADGQATEEDLERLLLRGMPELWEHRAPGGNLPSVWQTAGMVVRDRFKLNPLNKGEPVTVESRATEYAEMCFVLRCIFGNPFRACQPLPPAVLDWHDATIPRIAQGIYDYRAFHLMPILHDALLDAGCSDEELLMHCRMPEKHVRGCWAVDLILGKP